MPSDDGILKSGRRKSMSIPFDLRSLRLTTVHTALALLRLGLKLRLLLAALTLDTV